MAKRKLQYPGEICTPEERMIEKVDRRIFEPIPLPSVKLEDILELEKIIRPMAAPLPPRKGKLPDELVPMLTQEIKNREYKNFNIDTNVAVTDQPLGLRDLGIVADAMTVISVGGGGLSYKLNSPSNDPTPASTGLQETDFEIEEIYITTTGAGPGTAIIRVNWNPDIIRLRR